MVTIEQLLHAADLSNFHALPLTSNDIHLENNSFQFHEECCIPILYQVGQKSAEVSVLGELASQFVG